MQNTVLGIVAAALVASVVSFVVVSLSADSTVSSGDRAALAAIQERLDAIDKQLQASADLESRLLAIETEARGKAKVRGVRSDSESRGTVKVAGSDEAGLAKVVAEAAALEGDETSAGQGGLRDYVAAVIKEERKAREARRKEEEIARQREHEEMQKGPWGRHNYRVNSMAKRLDLDDRQKQYYYNTLIHYSDTLKERRKRVNWRNGDEAKEFHSFQKELAQEFDGALISGLDKEQAAVFKELSDWEKGRPGGEMMFSVGGDSPSWSTTTLTKALDGEMQTLTRSIVISGASGDSEPGDLSTLDNIVIETSEAVEPIEAAAENDK